MKPRIAVLAALLLLGACGGTGIAPGTSTEAISTPGACRSSLFEGSSFTNCVAVAGEQHVTMRLTDKAGKPLRSLAALKRDMGDAANNVAFAMNAGMFDEHGMPIGYYAEQGEQLAAFNSNKGPGNFHMLPNGVFWIEGGRFYVAHSAGFAKDLLHRQIDFGTQSGPMLMLNGYLHPDIAENGTSLYVRNAVGVDSKGRAHFVISDAPVSFGRLARFMRDKLDCADALYLDGAVSSLWYPAGKIMMDHAPLGPLIVVMKDGKEPE